jgi:hypothetical protein
LIYCALGLNMRSEPVDKGNELRQAQSAFTYYATLRAAALVP